MVVRNIFWKIDQSCRRRLLLYRPSFGPLETLSLELPFKPPYISCAYSGAILPVPRAGKALRLMQKERLIPFFFLLVVFFFYYFFFFCVCCFVVVYLVDDNNNTRK